MNEELLRLRQIHLRIENACIHANRDPADVRLLAVSKRQPAELVRRFFEVGQCAFGENRVQEALQKQQALRDVDIEWHFIGPVQSNKAHELATHFQWVQSVDRRKVLEKLSAFRPADAEPLNICLQVNIDREQQKSGLLPEQLADMAALAARSPGVRLRGLMAIPRMTDDEAETRDSFRRMKSLYNGLRDAGHEIDTLSIGMSADLELAIEEGSTMVRVGTDLMGQRPQ